MEGFISVRVYKWRGLYLRGPINGGAYTVKTRIQEHAFSGFRLIGFLYIGYLR